LAGTLTSQREIRTEDEFALESTRLKAAVCLGDLVKGDSIGDMRLDCAGCQQAEQPL
jgi:hypothetical protein